MVGNLFYVMSNCAKNKVSPLEHERVMPPDYCPPSQITQQQSIFLTKVECTVALLYFEGHKNLMLLNTIALKQEK